MKNVFHHVVIPAIVPMVFFTITAIPIELIGCRNRGLMAVGTALISGLLGMGAAARAAAAKTRRNPTANWWLGTAIILAIPSLFILAIEA
jgi:hypothetical protein